MNLYQSIVNDPTIKNNKQNFIMATGFNRLNHVALKLVRQGFILKAVHIAGSMPSIEVEHVVKHPLTHDYSIVINGGATRYAVRRKIMDGVKVESYTLAGLSEVF